MKHKVSKEEFDKLSDDFKKEYKPGTGDDDGSYILTVEGGEDIGALKRAKDYEKENAKQAKARVKELETEVGTLQGEITDLRTKAPDTKAIETSWQAKYDKLKGEKETSESSLRGEIDRMLVDETANSIAAELSDTPGVIKPHIKSRLMSEMVEGKAKLRIKDAEGNPSALTLDELKTEFKSNKDFASVLKGSGGSGGGAQGGQGGSGGGGKTNDGKKPDYTTASTKDIVAYRKTQRETQGE